MKGHGWDRNKFESKMSEVYKSSKITRPPRRYSPSLNYFLFTDGGELECYDKIVDSKFILYGTI